MFIIKSFGHARDRTPRKISSLFVIPVIGQRTVLRLDPNLHTMLGPVGERSTRSPQWTDPVTSILEWVANKCPVA